MGRCKFLHSGGSYFPIHYGRSSSWRGLLPKADGYKHLFAVGFYSRSGLRKHEGAYRNPGVGLRSVFAHGKSLEKRAGRRGWTERRDMVPSPRRLPYPMGSPPTRHDLEGPGCCCSKEAQPTTPRRIKGCIRRASEAPWGRTPSQNGGTNTKLPASGLLLSLHHPLPSSGAGSRPYLMVWITPTYCG